MKKDYNRCCHSLLRIEEVPFLFVFVCHPSALSNIYSAKDDTFYEEAPYNDIEVVDRIGSGDAYISGVLYGLLSHEGEYQRALEYGNAVSSLKNTIPGDLLSTDLKEIEGIIREHKSTGRVAEMDR